MHMGYKFVMGCSCMFHMDTLVSAQEAAEQKKEKRSKISIHLSLRGMENDTVTDANVEKLDVLTNENQRGVMKISN